MQTKLSMKLSLVFSALAVSLLSSAAFADDETAPAPKVPGKADIEYVVPHAVAYEGGSIPEGTSLDKRPNMAVVGTGLGIFAASYLPSVITAIVACGPQSDCGATKGAAWLYLPIVGPFITAATSTSTGGAALAAFDGGLQLTGATIAIVGLVAKKQFVVWQDKATKVAFTPGAGSSVAGVSLTLTHL
jgi:hypothetical protein